VAIPFGSKDLAGARAATAAGVSRSLPDALKNQEKELLKLPLAESRGKLLARKVPAAKLGIPRSTLDSKIKQLKHQEAQVYR